jgi:methylmalonyl-CoA mutase N-terminal domain/subunit
MVTDIEAMGGMTKAVVEGYPKRKIEEVTICAVCEQGEGRRRNAYKCAVGIAAFLTVTRRQPRGGRLTLTADVK